jgi:hypothetical protein
MRTSAEEVDRPRAAEALAPIPHPNGGLQALVVDGDRACLRHGTSCHCRIVAVGCTADRTLRCQGCRAAYRRPADACAHLAAMITGERAVST